MTLVGKIIHKYKLIIYMGRKSKISQNTQNRIQNLKNKKNLKPIITKYI